MIAPTRPSPRRGAALRVALEGLAVVLVVAATAGTTFWIQASEPTAQREAATRRSAALVETLTVERGSHHPTISALGVVRAAREIVLSPRVNGEIVSVAPAFVPGGRVEAGTTLLRIDPADYEQALVIRESEALQVRTELAIEQGQQRASRLEFELLGEGIDEENRALVLREPQIESLRAKLRASEAALAQARLDLARTEVNATFDAQIFERSVELGSQVGPGDALARLVATDEYWVMATVPVSAVRWIPLPGEGRGGAAARIHHRSVWADDEYREGEVKTLIGEVDAETRLARLIVSVPHPLDGDSAPPLILGTMVQVDIEVEAIDDAVRLDRAFLRRDDTVWIMDGGELRIRPVEVVFSDSRYAYVIEGLEPGEKVVTTSLATVADGLAIREADQPSVEPGGQP